jgi:type I restriction enzyme S subunit
MKYKPYSEYKDSGIQWIREIPEGWELIRLKYLLNRIDPGCWGSDFDEKGTIILRSTEIKIDGSWQIDDPATRSITEKERSNCLLKEGDLLVTKSSGSEKHIGKTALVNKDIEKLNCCFSNFMTRLRPNRKQKSKILHYFLNSDNARSQFNYFSNSTVGLGNLNEDCFKNLIFVKVPLDEQVKIQNFLDKKTAKIDDLIEKDKKLIELLKEKRIALINHTVTKGLPVQGTQTGLDPNAKMKDSGVEWIGEIQEGWEVNKIRNTSYIKGRIGWHGLTSEEYSNEGAYLVTGTNFKDGVIEWDYCHHVGWDRYKKDPYIHLKEDDLLITKDGTIGKVAIIKFLTNKATLNSGIFLVRPLNREYIPKFMYWMLNSAVFERFFDYIKTGATISHLYQETFERFFFPIPSLSEQLQIVEYLDQATSRIDKTIQKIEKKIHLLQEYKKSLIHHVVTGKIDIKEVTDE